MNSSGSVSTRDVTIVVLAVKAIRPILVDFIDALQVSRNDDDFPESPTVPHKDMSAARAADSCFREVSMMVDERRTRVLIIAVTMPNGVEEPLEGAKRDLLRRADSIIVLYMLSRSMSYANLVSHYWEVMRLRDLCLCPVLVVGILPVIEQESRMTRKMGLHLADRIDAVLKIVSLADPAQVTAAVKMAVHLFLFSESMYRSNGTVVLLRAQMAENALEESITAGDQNENETCLKGNSCVIQ